MSTTTPSDVLTDLVARFHEREAVGLKKYGTTLDRKDLTAADLRQHLLEELRDGCMYLVAEQRAAATDLDDTNVVDMPAEPDLPKYRTIFDPPIPTSATSLQEAAGDGWNACLREVERLGCQPSGEVTPIMVQKARDAYYDYMAKVVGHRSDGDEQDAMHAALVAALASHPLPDHRAHARNMVPKVWLSEQIGGEFDDLTAGQGYRRGWNDCRKAMLAAAPEVK